MRPKASAQRWDGPRLGSYFGAAHIKRSPWGNAQHTGKHYGITSLTSCPGGDLARAAEEMCVAEPRRTWKRGSRQCVRGTSLERRMPGPIGTHRASPKSVDQFCTWHRTLHSGEAAVPVPWVCQLCAFGRMVLEIPRYPVPAPLATRKPGEPGWRVAGPIRVVER